MRDHQIRALCDGFSQRGAYGQLVRHQDPETGKVTTTRVSFAAVLRRMQSELTQRAFPPKPRASKGGRYIQYPVTKIEGGEKVSVMGPRMVVG